MADASVKLGVSGISQFKSAMTEAAAAVKMTTAQLKQEEAQLKATGDKETYLQNKMSAMKAQIEQQTKYVNAAKEAYEKYLKTAPLSPDTEKIKEKISKMDTSSSYSEANSEEGFIDKIFKLFNK